MALDITAISDTQAEAGVIATLVQHPEFILHTDYLKPGYFYNIENSCIYWAIQNLYKNGIDTIDAINITNMLNSNHAVKKKIEEYNLSDMQEFISMSQYAARHSLEEYKLLVNTVVTMAFKRDLNRIAVQIQSHCFDCNMDLAKLNSEVNKKINKTIQTVLKKYNGQMDAEQIKEIVIKKIG